MGVMACDRNGCENIMCNTCVDGKYYVCWECRNAFKHYYATDKLKIMDSFKEFMKTEKQEFSYDATKEVNEFFAKHTREY